jgi:DNA polymerase-3 subunit chi
MPRVDFYLVGDPSPGASVRVACRLVEKAWQIGHRVYVQVDSAEAAGRTDDALWTFRQDSFVPHGRYPEEADRGLPVLIGYDDDPGGFGDVLVNLATAAPPFCDRFARVAEVVGADPQGREAGRTRYRFYRDRGYALETHEV